MNFNCGNVCERKVNGQYLLSSKRVSESHVCVILDVQKFGLRGFTKKPAERAGGMDWTRIQIVPRLSRART